MLSLHQDVSHGYNAFIPIISSSLRHVSTSNGVTRPSCRTKSDSGITRIASIPIIAKDTDSSFTTAADRIESFPIAVVLQRPLRTNQCLPRVTTQWGSVVLPVSDQWVQRTGLLVDDNEVDLLADLHTKTDLGEGCVPVGR